MYPWVGMSCFLKSMKFLLHPFPVLFAPIIILSHTYFSSNKTNRGRKKHVYKSRFYVLKPLCSLQSVPFC